MINTPKLNIGQQFLILKKEYPFGEIKLIGDQLIWKGRLKSSPIGDDYLIKVVYKRHKFPMIYVLEPCELKLPSGKNKLEHVYDHKRQRLCIYYPKAKEWNETKAIASTIFPWTIEWLYHYETWFITGEWKGGGIHPKTNKE